MDAKRELDCRLAELLGWTGLIRECFVAGKPPGSNRFEGVPHYSTNPSACAELDGEMRKRGYYLQLYTTAAPLWHAYYRKTGDRDVLAMPGVKVNELFAPSGFGQGITEWEARARAAIAALEKRQKLEEGGNHDATTPKRKD